MQKISSAALNFLYCNYYMTITFHEIKVMFLPSLLKFAKQQCRLNAPCQFDITLY